MFNEDEPKTDEATAEVAQENAAEAVEENKVEQGEVKEPTDAPKAGEPVTVA